jgi:hypothetical protein
MVKQVADIMSENPPVEVTGAPVLVIFVRQNRNSTAPI